MTGVYGAAAAPTEVKHRVARYDPAHGSDRVPKYILKLLTTVAEHHLPLKHYPLTTSTTTVRWRQLISSVSENET